MTQVPPIRLPRTHRGASPVGNPAVEQKADAYWKRAQEEIYRSVAELEAQDARERRHGLNLPKLSRGNPRLKELALTFDDGPHPVMTERLLALLRREGVVATFFVVGHQAEQYPNLIREEIAAGHTVGNHTFSHVTLTRLPLDDIRIEYRACSDVIREITGRNPRYCRPPGGDYDPTVVQGAVDTGLMTVLWTDDPGDYSNPGIRTIEQRTLEHLSNGGIILLHDGVQETLDILPQIIGYARSHGFRFVTLDELERGLGEAAPRR